MTETNFEDEQRPWSRRVVLRGVAVTGVAASVAALGSCGGDDQTQTGGDANGGQNGQPQENEPAEQGDGGRDYGGGGGQENGDQENGGQENAGALAQTSQIEVGGGRVFADEEVVITQPEKGTYKGFSAVCTHQGCTVSEVQGGTINCGCHGSMFNIADGSVASGPASDPLPEVQLQVEGGRISLA